MNTRWGLTIALLLVLAAGCAAPRPAPVVRQDPGTVSLQVHTVAEEGSGWRAIAPGEILHRGDRFALRIEVGAPVHLYVFQASSGGAPAVLWPIAGEGLARPGVPTHIPTGEGEWLGLEGAPGEEVLYVVSSTAALTLDQARAEAARAPVTVPTRDRDPPPTSTGTNRGYDKARHLLWGRLDGRGIVALRFAFQHQ